MIARRTFRPGRKTLRNGLESTIFAKLCGMTKRSFFCPHIACRVCHLKASEALWRRLSAARQWSAWSSENESVGAAIFAWHSWIVSKMIKDGAHDFPNPGGFGWFGDFFDDKATKFVTSKGKCCLRASSDGGTKCHLSWLKMQVLKSRTHPLHRLFVSLSLVSKQVQQVQTRRHCIRLS